MAMGAIGALTLISAESARRFTPNDVQLAEELALRAATAVENAGNITRWQGLSETEDHRWISSVPPLYACTGAIGS